MLFFLAIILILISGLAFIFLADFFKTSISEMEAQAFKPLPALDALFGHGRKGSFFGSGFPLA